MFVTIDEKEINEYIENSVHRKIDKLTDEYIEKKIIEKLTNKVDGIFSSSMFTFSSIISFTCLSIQFLILWS